MSRLDIWLVNNDYFISRQQSKRAIRAGLVTVNGNIAKPSTQVSGNETIEVCDSAVALPIGYSKLKSIEEILKRDIVTPESFALDIGSSAGGFLTYLSERCANIVGIEVSVEFTDRILNLIRQNHNLSMIIGDAFTINPMIISSECNLDTLLIDVTTDVDGTMKLIERYSSLLKHNGLLIAAFKQKPISSTIEICKARVSETGYHVLKAIILDSKRQEFHIAAIHQ